MPTLADLAAELGIPAETLQAKPEAVTKWNGYLADADTKYSQATAAQKEAEQKLNQVMAEQKVIDDNIAAYGMSDANRLALEANYAAMEAQLKTLKEQGIAVNLPSMPAQAPAPKNDFDPTAFSRDVNQSLIAGFDMQNRYQRLYGQAMPDDLAKLVAEAQQARQPLTKYVAEKYDFAGREKQMTADAQKKHDDEIRAAAVKEYQEKNPNTAGNPELARGLASRHPEIIRQRETGDNKTFSNLTARQKIAMSVSRSRQALAQQAS